VIRDVHSTQQLQVNEKLDESPVTIADLKVQKTLEVCLTALYPQLRVEGEESPESIKDIESVVDASTIDRQLLAEDLL